MATDTVINRPAPFVEDIGKNLAQQTVAQTQVPVVTTGLAGLGTMAQPTQQAFETAEQFKQRQDLFGAQQRAALGFEQRQQALSGLKQQVAGLDPLQQQAQQRAVAGLGSFQPFLTQAQKRQDLFGAQQRAALGFEQRQQALAGLAPQVAGLSAREQEARRIADAGIGSFQPFLTSAQQLTGAGAGTGTGTVAEFMSPYQQQVIDTTLQEFDRQAQTQEQRIRDQAVAAGAFGGGREGVQLAEFQTGSDRNRAALEAQLRQQNFGQAVARRDQAFRDQIGLASLVPQLTAGDVAAQGQLGAIDRTLDQATRDAQREATRQATFLPQEQLDRFASQVTGIMGGYPAQFQTTNIPNPSPLQQVLGIGSTLAGAYLGGLGRSGQPLFGTKTV